MNIPNKKLISGFELPSLGLGTWEIGGRKEKDANYKDENKDIEAIKQAYALGMTRFDTAEIYANGYAEEILGKAISEFDRSKLFISSKVQSKNLGFDDVIKSCEASLNRLKMDYLDLYMLHGFNQAVSLEQTMKAMDLLKERGLIKNIGVCNFAVKTFIEAQKLANNKIVLNQVHYNLIFREPVVGGVLEYCQKNDVIMEAWRPLQQGNLTKHGIQIVDEMCKKYNKTPSQIAINWMISQENVVTLFKTSAIEHLQENFGAIGWEMEKNDVDLLSNDFPIKLDRSNAVQLNQFVG